MWLTAAGDIFFLQNAHSDNFHIVSVFRVLQQTSACKNFENRLKSKKVIDIYDYDYALKSWLGIIS